MSSHQRHAMGGLRGGQHVAATAWCVRMLQPPHAQVLTLGTLAGSLHPTGARGGGGRPDPVLERRAGDGRAGRVARNRRPLPAALCHRPARGGHASRCTITHQRARLSTAKSSSSASSRGKSSSSPRPELVAAERLHPPCLRPLPCTPALPSLQLPASGSRPSKERVEKNREHGNVTASLLLPAACR